MSYPDGKIPEKGPGRRGVRDSNGAENATVLAALRTEIRCLELGAGGLRRPPGLPLGAPALDRRLPGGGLPLAALHLLEGLWGDWDDGAVTGFCLLLLQRLLAVRPGPVFWIAARRDLYAPGLLAAGLDPARFFLVAAGDEASRLWAMEEALREPALAAVVGEVDGLPRRAARRLQLAAETDGVTAFALNRGLWARPAGAGHNGGRGRGSDAGLGGAPSMVSSHWRLSALPAAGTPPVRWVAAPRWQAELLRCRGAAPAVWDVTWRPVPFSQGPFSQGPFSQGESHAADRLDLLAELRDGPLAPAASRQPGFQARAGAAERRLAG